MYIYFQIGQLNLTRPASYQIMLLFFLKDLVVIYIFFTIKLILPDFLLKL